MEEGSKLTPVKTGVSNLLSSIDNGFFEDEINTEMKALMEAIQHTGRGGEINIKLKIKPRPQHGAVEVVGEVKTKLPPQDKMASVLFMTPEGNFSRRDPRQRNLPFAEDDN